MRLLAFYPSGSSDRSRSRSSSKRYRSARQAIGTRKSEEEFEVWVRRLRNEAYIEYRLPSDAEAAKKLS